MRNSDCVKKKRGLTGSNTNESSWVSVVNVPRKRSILRAAFEMNRLRRWAPCLLTRSATSAQKTFALHRNFVTRCAPTSSPAWHFSHYATLLNYLDNPFHHLQLNWFVGAVIIFFFFQNWLDLIKSQRHWSLYCREILLNRSGVGNGVVICLMFQTSSIFWQGRHWRHFPANFQHLFHSFFFSLSFSSLIFKKKKLKLLADLKLDKGAQQKRKKENQKRNSI